jgi:hypothetical protein
MLLDTNIILDQVSATTFIHRKKISTKLAFSLFYNTVQFKGG